MPTMRTPRPDNAGRPTSPRTEMLNKPARQRLARKNTDLRYDHSPRRLLVGFRYVGRILASCHGAFATLVRRLRASALRLVGVFVVVNRFSAGHSCSLSVGLGAQLLQQRARRFFEEQLLTLVADLNERDVGEARFPVLAHRLDDRVEVRSARYGVGDVLRPHELPGA